MRAQGPLVLDVDDTFLKTDLLYECFWSGMGRAPIATLGACMRHLRDPAILKSKLCDIAELRADLLPVNADVAALAQTARAEGRDVILASASDVRLVRAVGAHHGFGADQCMGTVGGKNLKGSTKARALVAAYGERGFEYAGDARADMAVWPHAHSAVIVGDVAGVARKLTRDGVDVTHVAGGWEMRDMIRALRPHQWVKNVLLLLPLLAAHRFDLATLMLVICGMAAFCAAASSIYMVNDLLDLEADRLHPTKCKRPFASGAVPIRIGMMAFVGLAMIALGIGAALGGAFLAVVAGYMVLSLAYSLKLKRMRWVDIGVLAALYTIRVVAGAAAGAVYTSGFMLLFIFPVFATLGAVKRLTELSLATTDARLPGRGYGRIDRGALLNFAMASTGAALLIFFLYTHSPQARALYPDRWFLWLAMVPLAGWMFRMVRLGYYGKQDYDPIVFALRDKRGIGLIFITLSLMFYAAGLWAVWFGI